MVILSFLLLAISGTPSYSLYELRAQLAGAEQESVILQHKIDKLKEEIAYKEMANVRHQLVKAKDQLYKRGKTPKERVLSYLESQRTVLGTIMSTVPKCKSEAEKLNEELLSLITDIDNYSYSK